MVVSAPPPVLLSVVIITYNEAAHIGRCLRSVAAVADEVVVIDSGSTDETADICRAHGARVVTHPFVGHIEQKNYALTQATYPHVLSLDADEALSPALAAAIEAVKAHWQHDGYTMNRLSCYGTQWIRHGDWYPDRKLRLWDRRRGRWGGYNPHDRFELMPGSTTAHLPGDLLHYAYQNPDELISKVQQFSTHYARHHQHRKAVTPLTVFYKPVYTFLRSYVLKQGFRDGYAGLLIAGSAAAGGFYKYAKLYERNRQLTVTLIISTYNRPDALALVLQSVRQQRTLPEAVIVADDGSGPDTAEVVAAAQRDFPVPLHHCWHADEGFRLAAIRNRALATVATDYVIFVDGDMVLHPDFVADHRRAARRGCFVQGSRVLLGPDLTRRALAAGQTDFRPWQRGLQNRLNATRWPTLGNLVADRRKALTWARGANLAAWHADIVRVNGFDEAFVGWGREDSDFVARLQHGGVRRRLLKLGGVAYHLYHPEQARPTLSANDTVLAQTLATRAVACARGLNQYADSPATPTTPA